MTDGESEIKQAIHGFMSMVDGKFLALANGQARDHAEGMAVLKQMAAAAERTANALELQNRLLARQNNGHHTADQQETDHG